MKQLFFYVCDNCWRKALEAQTEYKGVVNLNVDKLPNGITYLYHTCFTCGTKQTVELNPARKEDLFPTSGDQLIRQRNKKFDQTKES